LFDPFYVSDPFYDPFYLPFLPNAIMLNMSIMFMSIGYVIGHIPLFTAMFATAFFRWIGAVM